ncbi:MAG TPA: DUF2281 domain-containing protein [Mucilaginibacter sp.]|jgi:hypothetical protein|nr:DUF2281 domain-containing protein [Mucilaginibacter sp.]
METLIINIPEKKSTLVKQMLKDMGVTIQQAGKLNLAAYKQKIAKVSTWTDDDTSTAGKRIPGGLKGQVSLPDDFNAPLDDLKDYMN